MKLLTTCCLIVMLSVAAFLLGRASASPRPPTPLAVSYQGKSVDHVDGVSGPATVTLTEKIDRGGSVSPAGVVVATP